MEKKHTANSEHELVRDWENRCRALEERCRSLEMENSDLENELKRIRERSILLFKFKFN